MTDFIDITLSSFQYEKLNKSYSTGDTQYRPPLWKGKKLYQKFKWSNQNQFSFLLTQNNTNFDISFHVKIDQPYSIIKIHLMTKNGQIIKIDSQFCRSYLIKKLIGNNVQQYYRPHINPGSGQIYFLISFFQPKQMISGNHNDPLNTIFQNINLSKLARSIEKIQMMHYESRFSRNINDFNSHDLNKGQSNLDPLYTNQHQLIYNNINEKNYFRQMSKLVSLLIEKDFIIDSELHPGKSQSINKTYFESQNQQHQNYNQIKNNQYTTKQDTVESINSLLNQKSQKRNAEGNKNKQKLIKKYIFALDQQKINLSNIVRKKSGKSNYQSLLINLSSQKQLKQMILEMNTDNVLKKTIKLSESQLGKITINLEKQDERTYKNKVKMLNSLPKNTEYHFLDKYFKNQLNLPINLILSLKEESLPKFLENNRVTISVETKLRIFLQLLTAAHTFWEQKNIILYLCNLKKIFVTKNLTIKIRSLSNFFKVQPHMILQQRKLVNKKLLNNFLNICQIYFKIIFNQDFVYLRPAKRRNSESPLNESNKSENIFQNLVHIKLIPEGFYDNNLKHILCGLNYIFLSYVNKAIENQQAEAQRIQKKVPVFHVHNEQIQETPQQTDDKMFNYRYICCWLLKIFQTLNDDNL